MTPTEPFSIDQVTSAFGRRREWPGHSGCGGAIYDIAPSSSTLVNYVLWDNSPDEIFGSAVVTYSDIQGGFAGDGNIDADPLFVDPNIGNHRLSPASPCIDAGDNDGVPADTLDLDGDGDGGRESCKNCTRCLGSNEVYSHSLGHGSWREKSARQPGAT